VLDKAAVSARIGGPAGRRAEAQASVRTAEDGAALPVVWDLQDLYRVYSLGQRLLYFVQVKQSSSLTCGCDVLSLVAMTSSH
jgi:hypothetical protein